MEFGILGPLEVRSERGEVAVAGGKPAAVLAVLLLHANEPVSAERLAIALWGEDAPGGASKTVQVHVSRLRKALGDPEILITTPAGYRLARAARTSSTPSASRSWSRTAAQTLAAGEPAQAGGGAARGADAVARAAARRLRVRAVRAAPRSRGWRSSAWRRWRRAWRPTSRPAAHAERRGRAAAPRRRAPDARAAGGAADARALPLRPPGRGARGLPRRAPRAGRGDRRGARAGAARPAGGDPAPGPGARPAGAAPSCRPSSTR